MVDISREMYDKNRVETIADSDKILCFNDRDTEEELDDKNL